MTTDLFRVRSLEAVRQLMIDNGVSRKVVNQRVGCIRRCFKWAEGKELAPAGTISHLMALTHLKPGRSEAKERDSVEPVEWERVKPTLFHLSEKLRAMVLFQWWTGARPGEVRVVRGEEIDRSGDVWLYRPGHHKTTHRGKQRIIPIGPKAQEILQPWMKDEGYVFLPRSRRTPYDKQVFARSIMRACLRAEVQPWSPNQLRHAAATRIEKEIGLEAARVVLGHSSAQVTESVYVSRDLDEAVAAMRKLG